MKVHLSLARTSDVAILSCGECNLTRNQERSRAIVAGHESNELGELKCCLLGLRPHNALSAFLPLKATRRTAYPMHADRIDPLRTPIRVL